MAFSRQGRLEVALSVRFGGQRLLKSSGAPELDLSRFHHPEAANNGLVRYDLMSLLRNFLGELFAHQAMQQIHSLERAHHHLEMNDALIGAEGDDVDAVVFVAFA